MNDPGCTGPGDWSGFGTVACDDGIDNDGDTWTDYPDDLQCWDPTDPDEMMPGAPQCSDGMDNDADFRRDYPEDPGCSSENDWYETS